MHMPPYAVYTLAWVLSWWLVSRYLGFGAVYFGISGIVFIFNNLGTKKDGELSAYAAFNAGQRGLPGTMNADQFDQSMRAGGTVQSSAAPRFATVPQRSSATDGEDDNSVASFNFEIASALLSGSGSQTNLSKIANAPCLCGSGRKTKKCCASAEAQRAVAAEERRRERREQKHTARRVQ